MSTSSPLVTAACRGHTEVIDCLLEHHDIEVNKPVSGGGPHFCSNAIEIRKAMCYIIYRHASLSIDNCSVSRPTMYPGWTALMWAAWYGHTAVVSRLVGVAGLARDQLNTAGKCAVMYAAEAGRTEAARLLLEDADSFEVELQTNLREV